MRLFQQENTNEGFLYYILANPYMTFYTQSLKKLSLREYLFINLRKNGFQRIYFINCFVKDIRVEIMNVDSIYGFINEKRKEMNYDIFSREMLNLLNSDKKAAFVFEGGIEGGLCHLGRFLDRTVNLGRFIGLKEYKQNQTIGELINENASNYYNKYGHCFIVCDSGKASNLVTFFFGQNHLFNNYPKLFRSIRKVLANQDYYSGKLLLSSLQKELGEQFIFWNEINKENIYRIICRHLLFEQENFIAFDENLMNDMTEIIYYWYHYWDMRKIAPKLLPVESWKLPGELNNSVPKIMRLRDDLRKDSDGNLEKTLFDLFGNEKIESELLSIEMNIGPAEKLFNIWSRIRHLDVYSDEKEKLFQIYISYLKLYRYDIHNEIKNTLSHASQTMEDSLENSDIKTFIRCMKVLEFCKRYDLLYAQFPDKGIESCTNIIKFSQEAFEQECIIENNKKELEILNDIITRNKNKVLSLRSRGIPDSDIRVNILMEKIIDANNQYKYIESVNYRTMRALNLIDDTLSQLELYLQNSSNLEGVMKSIQKVREETSYEKSSLD